MQNIQAEPPLFNHEGHTVTHASVHFAMLDGCKMAALMTPLLSQVEMLLSVRRSRWTKLIQQVIEQLSKSSPAWQPYKDKLLDSTEQAKAIRTALLENEHAAKLGPLLAQLAQLQSVMRRMEMLDPAVEKYALTATEFGISTVCVTFAIRALYEAIPKLKGNDPQDQGAWDHRAAGESETRNPP